MLTQHVGPCMKHGVVVTQVLVYHNELKSPVRIHLIEFLRVQT